MSALIIGTVLALTIGSVAVTRWLSRAGAEGAQSQHDSPSAKKTKSLG